MTRKEEFGIKLKRMRDYMGGRGAGCLALQRVDNFAWATCGGANHVNTAADTGVATLLVTKNNCAVITNRIEAGRIRNEELAGLDIPIEELPWADDRNAFIAAKYGEGGIASDSPAHGFASVGDEFIRLMAPLTSSEIERFRSLGADTGAALEAAARSIKPGMTENETAARLSSECYNRDVLPIVALIAADDRLLNFRHPIPTGNRIDKIVMLVVCGRRHGLIASATRLASFGPVGADLRRRHDACVRVDAAFNTLTRPGADITSVFRSAAKTYKDAGFDNEWLLHHQGGPCGYRTRYYTANDKTEDTVVSGSAFAWNPSITGTKSEDTIIVLDDRNEFITHTGEWEYVDVEFNGIKLSRPDIMKI